MFTKKQYEEFEELTTPIINWIKELEDPDVLVTIDGAEAVLHAPQLVNMDYEFKEMTKDIDEFLDTKKDERSKNEADKPSTILN